MDYRVEYMECDLCHKKLYPLDAHCGRLRKKFTTAHIDCWNKAVEVEKEEDIFDANEACDTMINCNQCSATYRGFQGDSSLIPCNFIRKKYGESIWDYKEEYKTKLKLR